MYDTLYQYLIFNRQLSLPGIGTIHLQRMPAQFDYANRMLLPPRYNCRMDTGNDKPSKKLFDWLSGSLGITEWDAIRMVNEFSFELKKKIGAAREIHWKRVGVIRRNETGRIVIEPEEIIVEQPVPVEKLIHDRTEHKTLAGDIEKIPVEMEKTFPEKEVKRDYGWIVALILTVAALMFAGWYFSEKGMNPPAAGNQSVIKQRK